MNTHYRGPRMNFHSRYKRLMQTAAAMVRVTSFMKDEMAGNMKNICAILFLFVFSVFASAQSQPKTVTDFYLALPNSKVDVNGLEGSDFDDPFFFLESKGSYSESKSTKYRRSLIKIEDTKNGYLKLGSNQWEGWAEITLFKKTDGSYVIAVSEVGCGPGCSGWVIFLTYNRGKWTDVSEQIFPVSRFSDDGYFKLPRVGTTIELIDGEDVGTDESIKLAEFRWNKTKFVRQEKTR